MKLSLSGFLFEDGYASQSVTFGRFCELAKSAGYDGVELRDTQVNPDTPAAQREAIRRELSANNLEVTCLTARGLPAGGVERDEFFHRHLDLCLQMECQLLKITSDAKWLRLAAEKARNHGVRLAANNHINSPLETAAGTRRFLDEVSHPNFGLLYDSMHLQINGEDYLALIPQVAGVTCNILFHSMRPARDGATGTVPRNGRSWNIAMPDEPGVQDWPNIFRSFKSLGYTGLVTVIESGWPLNQREEVARHCAIFIKRLWEGNDKA
jgi:sugar phosphate isomerase/epimerase